KVKEVAAEDGLEIDIKVFNDYPMVNIALAEGELDVNSFQHEPYLEQMIKDRNVELVAVADTGNVPMLMYSDRIKDSTQGKAGDRIGTLKAPHNGPGGLLLFEQAGLIKLKKGIGIQATVKDIVENPLDLELVELEAAQIPRQLDEFAAAAINTNFAVEHGLLPTRDAIFMEPKD